MAEKEQIEKMCCVECFDYDGIKIYVQEVGNIGNCSYCGSHNVVVADVDTIGEFVKECFYKKYEDAANSVGYESAEGGYNLGTDTIDEILLYELAIFSDKLQNPELLCDDLVNSDGTPFVRIDPYGPISGGQELSDMWKKFSLLVKTNRRFSILLDEPEKHDSDAYDDYPRSVPEFIESLIGLLFEQLQIEYKLGETIYRSRIHNGSFIPCHEELTSPPREKTINNRMSPKGVKFFYGSLDSETSIAEVRPQIGTDVIVGKFKARKMLSLLDLSKKGLGHSIFDREYEFHKDEFYNPFLERFLGTIAKPIAANDPDIEYLPTQVFIELIRFHPEHKCDGLLYRSSQNVKGINIVLFNEENVSTSEDKDENAWLNFIGYEIKRIVSLKYKSHDVGTT